VSVNEVTGSALQQDSKKLLQIEMQSGDVIEIMADELVLPYRLLGGSTDQFASSEKLM